MAKNKGYENWMLLPSNDHAVYNISKHKDILSRYFKIITPKAEIIEKIYNKQNLIGIARSIGVPVPVSYFKCKELAGNPQDAQFPLITRGKFGLSFYKLTHHKAYISENATQYKNHVDEIEKFGALDISFTQEVIPLKGNNKTISFAAFCIDGVIKSYWIGEKLRDHPFNFGTATFAISIENKECLEYSEKLVEKLNYTGVCEIEFLKNPETGSLNLIEINARTWLWVGLADKCGVNFPKLIYDFLYTGKVIKNYKYQVGLRWFNLFSDVLFSIQNIVKGRLKIGTFFMSYQLPLTEATFSKSDIRPFLMYLIFIPRFLRNR
ncbi:MAG: hypothetical protein KQI35_03570 [Bacteroidetes bacterium]|nr:hypothetical protein [Bacteroidota bacterium]